MSQLASGERRRDLFMGRALPAPAMVLGGVASLEGGAVVARGLFPTVGVPGVVALRLGFGAVILGGLRRPRLPGDRRTLALAAVTGVVLAVHHLAFYAAVDRLPLGVATTLEFCGPLAVALAGSRRALHVLWAALAAAGVVLASGFGSSGDWQGPGIALALVAAGCWACYIMVFPRLGRRMDPAQGLAAVTVIGAVIAVPYGIAIDGRRMLTPAALGLGAAIALLADVLAYSLQATALGRMPGRLFSILASTEPAIGALFGLAVLGQHIDALQWAGIVAVAVASAGASLDKRLSQPAMTRPDNQAA